VAVHLQVLAVVRKVGQCCVVEPDEHAVVGHFDRLGVESVAALVEDEERPFVDRLGEGGPSDDRSRAPLAVAEDRCRGNFGVDAPDAVGVFGGDGALGLDVLGQGRTVQRVRDAHSWGVFQDGIFPPGHEGVDRDGVRLVVLDRFAVDVRVIDLLIGRDERGVGPLVLDATDLELRLRAEPIVTRWRRLTGQQLLDLGTGQFDGHERVVERQDAVHVVGRHFARTVHGVGTDPAGVRDRDVRARLPAERVGDHVTQRGLVGVVRTEPRVQFDLGRPQRRPQVVGPFALDERTDFFVHRDVLGVLDQLPVPRGDRSVADGEVDLRDVVALALGFDDDGPTDLRRCVLLFVVTGEDDVDVRTLLCDLLGQRNAELPGDDHHVDVLLGFQFAGVLHRGRRGVQHLVALGGEILAEFATDLGVGDADDTHPNAVPVDDPVRLCSVDRVARLPVDEVRVHPVELGRIARVGEGIEAVVEVVIPDCVSVEAHRVHHLDRESPLTQGRQRVRSEVVTRTDGHRRIVVCGASLFQQRRQPTGLLCVDQRTFHVVGRQNRHGSFRGGRVVRRLSAGRLCTRRRHGRSESDRNEARHH